MAGPTEMSISLCAVCIDRVNAYMQQEGATPANASAQFPTLLCPDCAANEQGVTIPDTVTRLYFVQQGNTAAVKKRSKGT